MLDAALPSASFPILTSVEAVRSWRASQAAAGLKVGFVPTMGALHSGHMSLVKRSLQECDSTVVSIFVNPAQFAPHEDLATYPRTLEADLKVLESTELAVEGKAKRVSALFLPPVSALYPSGISTHVPSQRGAFVEVKGLQEVMEGASRPGFFRGVATVVLKLFNLVQPNRAFFGQKDIQQALLLRRMLTDLHVPNPLPKDLVIVETYRDEQSSLALSSRNAYLSKAEFPYATVLIDALRAGQQVWTAQSSAGQGVKVEQVLAAVREKVAQMEKAVEGVEGVEVKLLYVALNDPEDLWDLEKGEHAAEGGVVPAGKGAVLSGAVMLGRTRLIDNLVFDYPLN